MATFTPRGSDWLPPLPLNDQVSITPRSEAAVNPELNQLRASIESTIEQHLHDRTIAFLLSNAEIVLHQQGSSPFHTKSGVSYHTIHEFATGAQKMPPIEFGHHVNHQRNDFANWINDCFPEPAKKLGEVLRAMNREEILALLKHLEEMSLVQKPALPAPPERIPFQPLPPAPIALPTSAEHIDEELRSIQRLSRTDMAAARDKFIQLRTYVWQQLGEDERRTILPRLRDTYEMLVRN